MNIMMTDLIVDFPQHCRLDAKRVKKARKVHFSATEIRYVEPYRKADRREAWYSSKDYDDMRAANRKAVADHRINLMRSVRDPNFRLDAEQPNELEIIGLEKLLSVRIIRKITLSKERHWNAVLREQEIQADSNVNDVERLACISRRHSEWSVARARSLGLLQSQ